MNNICIYWLVIVGNVLYIIAWGSFLLSWYKENKNNKGDYLLDIV